MPQILIRDVDERILSRLKERAARNDRSLQAELQLILQRAANTDVVTAKTIAARIRRKLGDRKHSDSTALIAEDRRR